MTAPCLRNSGGQVLQRRFHHGRTFHFRKFAAARLDTRERQQAINQAFHARRPVNGLVYILVGPLVRAGLRNAAGAAARSRSRRAKAP